MNCAQAHDLLGPHLDGELDAAASRELSAHVEGCAGCQRALRALRTLDADLAAAIAPERAGAEDLVRRIVAAAPAPGRGGRRPALLGLALAAAAGFLLAYLAFGVRAPSPSGSPGNVPPSPWAARCEIATGLIEVREPASDRWVALAPGATVPSASRVRCAAAVKCALILNDGDEAQPGSELRVNGGSEVEILAPRRLVLARGQIYTRVKPAAEAFVVRTEQATIEAVGTVLDITHVPAGTEDERKPDASAALTELVVVEGAARMQGQELRQGFQRAVVNGSLQAERQVWELGLATSWVNELLTLRGRDQPELTRRVNEMLAMIGRTKMEYLYEWEIRSLGDHCVLPLTRFLQSSNGPDELAMRRHAAQIVADLAGPDRLLDLAMLLQSPDAEVRTAIARGLERITGQSLGFEASYWQGADVAAGVKAWREFAGRTAAGLK